MKVCEVTENEIALNLKIFDDCKDVPGIKKVHCVVYKEGTMRFYPNDLDRHLNCRAILERAFEEPSSTSRDENKM